MEIMKNKLWIIANENMIQPSVFTKDVSSTDNYSNALREFNNRYQLNLNIDDYFTSAYLLAEMGHMVVMKNNIDKQVIIYIPREVTVGQLNWFRDNQSELSNTAITAMVNGYILSDGVDSAELHSINEVLLALDKNRINVHSNFMRK